ncbi:hypothetical protein ACFLUF_02350, partial [Chloroflexota bacterium]
SLYVGEGATMALEACILGVPSIRIGPFVDSKDYDRFDTLKNIYGLVFFFDSVDATLEKAIELMSNPTATKEEWQEKSSLLINSKVDLTEFMIDFVEDYPESFYRYQMRGV